MTYKSWLKQYVDGDGVVADFAARALQDAKKAPSEWDFPSNKFEGRYQGLREHLMELGETEVGLSIFKETWEEWAKAEKKAAANRRKKARR